MKFRLHSKARLEFYESIVWFYENTTIRTGNNFAKEIGNAFRLIMENPFAFQKEHGNVRKFTVQKFQYKVWYEVYEDEIFVLAISHSRMKPDYWTDRTQK